MAFIIVCFKIVVILSSNKYTKKHEIYKKNLILIDNVKSNSYFS